MLVGFLEGCTKTSNKHDEGSDKKTNAIVHAIEQVLLTRNLLTVSPHSFQRNIIQYCVTGSKLATNLNGSCSPAGSCTKVDTYIKAPSEPPVLPREGDLHIAVDNEQRVGKSSGRIREGSSICVDICTTMLCLQTAEKTHLQENELLKPEVWRKRGESEDKQKVMDDVELQEQKYVRIFRQYRQDFITEVLQDVSPDKDHVDIAIQQHRESGGVTYVCNKCNNVNADDNICARCSHDPNQPDTDYDPYHRTKSKHPSAAPTIQIGEPAMVNPCSKAAMKTVFEHVKEHTNVDSDQERKWVYVWCDAVPFLMGSKLQEEL